MGLMPPVAPMEFVAHFFNLTGRTGQADFDELDDP